MLDNDNVAIFQSSDGMPSAGLLRLPNVGNIVWGVNFAAVLLQRKAISLFGTIIVRYHCVDKPPPLGASGPSQRRFASAVNLTYDVLTDEIPHCGSYSVRLELRGRLKCEF